MRPQKISTKKKSKKSKPKKKIQKKSKRNSTSIQSPTTETPTATRTGKSMSPLRYHEHKRKYYIPPIQSKYKYHISNKNKKLSKQHLIQNAFEKCHKQCSLETTRSYRDDGERFRKMGVRYDDDDDYYYNNGRSIRYDDDDDYIYSYSSSSNDSSQDYVYSNNNNYVAFNKSKLPSIHPKSYPTSYTRKGQYLRSPSFKKYPRKGSSSSSSTLGKGKGKSKIRPQDPPRTQCCSGGISFLIIELIGIEDGGKLSIRDGDDPCNDFQKEKKLLNPSSSSELFPTIITDTNIKMKQSPSKGLYNTDMNKKQDELRFVSCQDICIQQPYNKQCLSSNKSIIVNNGDLICFGTWDSEMNRISFGQKMPMTITLAYESSMNGGKENNDNTAIFFANLHTSCSKPLHPPYAIQMTSSFCNDENNAEYFQHTEEISNKTLISFKDGISIDYYQKHKSNWQNYDNTPFSLNFASCGCNCEGSKNGNVHTSGTTNSYQSETNSKASAIDTIHPSSAPFSTTSSPTTRCNSECFDWIGNHCIMDLPDSSIHQCIYHENYRTSSIHTLHNSKKESHLEEVIQYHKTMETLFRTLLHLL